VTLPVLRADCASCFGLCCVLVPFSRDAGFGTTKASGVPCHHLQADDRCGIHATLREDGWPGCTVFDCFGAGQQVSQVTYGGVSWRDHDDLGEMAAVLSVMRQLHEMLRHLVEAEDRVAGVTGDLLDRLTGLVAGTPAALLALDVDGLRGEVGEVLAVASGRLRAAWPAGADLARGDLAGRDLRRTDLRGAALRGALLIAADLRGVDLTGADLLGADLRDCDVRGASLSGALFLTQPQVNAARGDAGTTLPGDLARPGHWLGE
jgi:uncharacterized protein YjbI with pentapeptide repeats